jgi:hypothetical protein
MARSTKAKEYFGLHVVRQSGGQNAATYKPLGVLEVTRKNQDGSYVNDSQDGIWLQLVPGLDFSRARNNRAASSTVDLNGQAMRLQFDSIHVHSQHPPFSRIDFKG